MKFKLENEDYILELSGVVDEKTQFPTEYLPLAHRVVFECEKISFINSYGILLWSKWIREKDKRLQFVFRAAPPRLVDVFNTVQGYFPSECVVESFFVPYDCENCEHEDLYFAQRGKDYLEAQDQRPMKLLLPNELNCPKCKSGMKIGRWENLYFRFLEKR